MDYRIKYQKYKLKYLHLKNQLNEFNGGINKKSQKAWDIRDDNKLYLSVEIDKDSYLGKEYFKRLKDMKNTIKTIKIPYTGENPFKLHTSILEILIPDNNLNKKINEILNDVHNRNIFLDKIKILYELYLQDVIMYSELGNYKCLGAWFVRVYDDTELLNKIADNYIKFKYMMIITLLESCGLNCSDINKQKLTTKNYTYYFDNENNPFFVIGHFFNKPDPQNKIGWVPHISMIKDVNQSICNNIFLFMNTQQSITQKSLKRSKSTVEQNETLRFLPFWNTKNTKEITLISNGKEIKKNITGTISNILFSYNYNQHKYEITF